MKNLLFVVGLMVMSCNAIAGANNADSTKRAPLLLKNINNKTISTTAEKGKVLFLNFWAMSCVPCLEEMPGVNRLAVRFKNDTNLLMLPVDMDGELQKSSNYMAKEGYGLAVYGIESVVPAVWFRGVLPTTVVIDKHGDVVYYHEGSQDYDSAGFVAFIDGLLKNKKG